MFAVAPGIDSLHTAKTELMMQHLSKEVQRYWNSPYRLQWEMD